MASFTIDDLTVLFEALDAWKSKDDLSEFIDIMIPTLTARNREEAIKANEEHDRRKFALKQTRAAEKANRKECAIILQAKILEMRRELEAAQSD